MAQKRVDMLLLERGLCQSREQARARILAGEVWSGQMRVDKAGTKMSADVPLEIRGRAPLYVSRSGEKLLHALNVFGIPIAKRVCLDIGASTGGFTDCLLRAGALHVFSIDVGYGQLDQKLRNDSRVTNVEKTNARYLTLDTLRAINPAADSAEVVVIDVSFISLTKVILPLRTAFPRLSDWILLFKPQFEVGRKHVSKGGLVRSQEAVTAALSEFDRWMVSLGFVLTHGPETSPLPGKKSGNLEYLIHYVI